MAPLVYGLFLGVGIQVFLRTAPQPVGSIVWWGGLAVQLACAAVVVWRRMSLPLMTIAFTIAALGCSFNALLAVIGYIYPNLPTPAWFAFGAASVTPPILMSLESRRRRAEYDAWKAHIEAGSVWDMLAFRHIPNLNQRRRENARASS